MFVTSDSFLHYRPTGRDASGPSVTGDPLPRIASSYAWPPSPHRGWIRNRPARLPRNYQLVVTSYNGLHGYDGRCNVC